MTQESVGDDAPVLVSVVGSLGRIELNRPRAINALTNDMVGIIADALEKWRGDERVTAVLLTGRGERGLCAGGDIKAIYEDLKAGRRDSIAFWRTEYRMNHAISVYPKPFVALMSGITMGGGVGVSTHGSHRIVTETSKVGMPETAIGLFPDVGVRHLLARMPRSVGRYLGLTGLPVGPGAALAYGFADAFVAEERVPSLIADLEADASAADALVFGAATAPPPDELAEHVEWIDAAFSANTVEEILATLRERPEAKAQETADLLETRSPTSLKLTLAGIISAESLDLRGVLEQDYALAVNLTDLPDLFEGIRAQVIDKDRNPAWRPATLADVDEQAIQDALASHATPGVFDD